MQALTTRFIGGAVDDQAGGNIHDLFHLDKAVGFQRRAGGNEIDDALGQAQARGDFHRAVQFDAFGLHAARGEMPLRQMRVFGGDADVAPAGGVIIIGERLRLGHRQAAMPDAQIDRALIDRARLDRRVSDRNRLPRPARSDVASDRAALCSLCRLDDDVVAYGVYSDDGIQLAVFSTEEAAYYSARLNHLEPMLVH